MGSQRIILEIRILDCVILLILTNLVHCCGTDQIWYNNAYCLLKCPFLINFLFVRVVWTTGGRGSPGLEFYLFLKQFQEPVWMKTIRLTRHSVLLNCRPKQTDSIKKKPFLIWKTFSATMKSIHLIRKSFLLKFSE